MENPEHYNVKILTYKDGKQKRIIANQAIFQDMPKKEEKQINLGVALVEKKPKEPPKADEKDVEHSIIRAQNKVFDLCYENEFTHFYTLTFNQEKYNSHEAREILKRTRSFLMNVVNRHGLKYVLTAERHKKGGIHLHMVANCPFQLVDSGTRLVEGYTKPVKLETIQKKKIPPEQVKKVVYNIPEWKHGFTTAIEIDGDPAALSQYLTKYITKDIHKIFGKYYWSSKNLKRSPEITYTNTPFAEVQAPIYNFDFGLALKYKSDFSVIE